MGQAPAQLLLPQNQPLLVWKMLRNTSLGKMFYKPKVIKEKNLGISGYFLCPA